MASLGWDIGGVNTKAALVVDGRVADARVRPFELQRAPGTLAGVLRALAAEILGQACGGAAVPVRHAVTMTAELSQMFRTKRDGVAFVLDAVEAAFPGSPIDVYTVDGRFVAPAVARAEPLKVAAANWSATAHAVARVHADAILIDIGTTTTDIIPIAGGVVVASGWTDPERLATGELVYTGAVRTPAEALAACVPLGDGTSGVSAEGFALAGDVHLWRGDLRPEEYTAPTPDGRPPTREFAAERLARVVCADREMLDERDISRIAGALAAAQERRIVDAIVRVRDRHRSLRVGVVTGVGHFLAARAAHAAGLDVVELADEFGAPAARHAPAAAVALLLDAGRDARDDRLSASYVVAGVSRPASSYVVAGFSRPTNESTSVTGVRNAPRSAIDIVVKVGGGLLAHAAALDATLRAIAGAARDQRVVVVPGGGPFADAVRDLDARVGLTDTAAHWMAILAMDQYGHLLASRVPGAVIVRTAEAIGAALDEGRLPILAPAQWLQSADPLPHTWEVTSDSLAAWIADAVGAARLLVIKPPGAKSDLVDRYFTRSAGAARTATIVAANSFDAVAAALRHPLRHPERQGKAAQAIGPASAGPRHP